MPRRRPQQPVPEPDGLPRDLVAVALATLGVLILLSLLPTSGERAYFAFVSEGLLRAFGYGAYLIGALLIALAIYFWLEKTNLSDRRVALGVALLFLVAVTLMHLPRAAVPDPFTRDMVRTGGGYLGAGLAWVLYRGLGYAGVTRVDFIIPPDGTPFILEINTLPGMTATSLVPKIAAGLGIGFPDLCERILEGAALKA